MSAGNELLIKIIQEARLQDFGKINPEWLAAEERQTYELMKTFTLKYGTLPPLSKIKRFDSYDKAEIASTPYTFFFDSLVDRAITVDFMNNSSQLNKLFADEKPRDAVMLMKQLVQKYDSEFTSVKDVYTMPDMINMTLEYIREARTSGGMIGVPSGWPSLDRATAGFRGGNVYVFAARPKMGKSMLLAYMCMVAYSLGYIPMMISMEMTTIEMALRMVAVELGLDMNCLFTGQISTFAERRIQELIPVMEGRQPFHFINGQFKKDITEVSSLVNGVRPHIVYIDGGYLIKLLRGYNRMARHEIVADIAEQIKTLSTTSNVPIVITFQLNRAASKSKDINYEHLQLSDAIGQLASLMAGLFEDEDTDTRRRIEIVGGRHNVEDQFYVNWSWTDMNFTEVISNDNLMEGVDGD